MIRRGAHPDVDVLLSRRDHGRARHRDAELAGEFGDRSHLRKRQRLADARAGLALQLLELGIGADQPAGAVDAAGNPPWLDRSACHQRSSMAATAPR